MTTIEYLIDMIEKSLTRAEEALEDKKGYGMLIAYSNCMYNIGRYHAYMDSLDDMGSDTWIELVHKHKDRMKTLEEKEDAIYRSLKQSTLLSSGLRSR